MQLDPAFSASASNDRRSGVTLTETLIAMFLLSIFVAGSVQILTSVRRSADLARMNYQALNMAKDRIERIRAFHFNQLGLAVEPPTRLNEHGAHDPNGLFRRTTTVVSTNNMRRVHVIVEVFNPRTQRFEGMRQTLTTQMADIEFAP